MIHDLYSISFNFRYSKDGMGSSFVELIAECKFKIKTNVLPVLVFYCFISYIE